MIDQDYSLMLCTNGDEHNRPALKYGVWLAGLLDKPVVLLGIAEKTGMQENLNTIVEETAAELENASIPYRVHIEGGRGSVAIARFAREGNFLTVLGRLGRPSWRRFLQGRSFRRVMEYLNSPILYVPQSYLPIKRILVCLGGLGYASVMENLCLQIGKAAKAEICLLHVVEPVTLEYPVSKAVHDHWKEIIDTDTVVGGNLRRGMESAQDMDLDSCFKVRQGSIMHEIIKEVESGNYDLVGMGSAYSAHTLRHLYLPNITAEIAETIERPVLTARIG
jgi:nucleotide-binding universal stress UspA family protein